MSRLPFDCKKFVFQTAGYAIKPFAYFYLLAFIKRADYRGALPWVKLLNFFFNNLASADNAPPEFFIFFFIHLTSFFPRKIYFIPKTK